MPSKIKHPVVDGKKMCSQCGGLLPIDEFSKTRYHYSSKCKNCRIAYAADYRKRPDVILRSIKYRKEYMSNPDNRARKNETTRKWRKGDAPRQRYNQMRRSWALMEKRKAIAYKGGACAVCGYDKCEAALEFHHLNPKEKDGLRAHWTFDRNKRELDKCILLCCRCHREVHSGTIETPNLDRLRTLRDGA